MRTPEEILKDRLEANGYEWEHIRMWADIKPYLPIIYSAMFHHSVEYMKEMRQQKRNKQAEIEKLRRNLGHLMTWIGKEHPDDLLRLMDEMTQQDFINSPQNLNRDTMIIGFRKP